jgi:hypothetical protein
LSVPYRNGELLRSKWLKGVQLLVWDRIRSIRWLKPLKHHLSYNMYYIGSSGCNANLLLTKIVSMIP